MLSTSDLLDSSSTTSIGGNLLFGGLSLLPMRDRSHDCRAGRTEHDDGLYRAEARAGMAGPLLESLGGRFGVVSELTSRPYMIPVWARPRATLDQRIRRPQRSVAGHTPPKRRKRAQPKCSVYGSIKHSARTCPSK